MTGDLHSYRFYLQPKSNTPPVADHGNDWMVRWKLIMAEAKVFWKADLQEEGW